MGFLRCVLHCFEAVFELSINLAKSELFRVGEVSNLEVLTSILGCRIGSLPTTYLGLLLGASFKSSLVWEPVVERIRR